MSEALAYVLLASWLLAEGMGVAYNFPPRPKPYLAVALVFTVAAVWLALRVLL